MPLPHLRVALVILAGLTAAPTHASCDDPAWDSTATLAELAAAAPPDVATARDRVSVQGLVLSLAPVAEVKFEAPPERPPRNPDSRGAVLHFAAGTAGIAHSDRAWIDIIRDGQYLAPVAFVDIAECADLQKIVAFEIGPGPFTLQLSAATVPSIAAAITPRP